jgi:hypothetical protein
MISKRYVGISCLDDCRKRKECYGEPDEAGDYEPFVFNGDVLLGIPFGASDDKRGSDIAGAEAAMVSWRQSTRLMMCTHASLLATAMVLTRRWNPCRPRFWSKLGLHLAGLGPNNVFANCWDVLPCVVVVIIFLDQDCTCPDPRYE